MKAFKWSSNEVEGKKKINKKLIIRKLEHIDEYNLKTAA